MKLEIPNGRVLRRGGATYRGGSTHRACVVDGGNNQVVCTFNDKFEGKDNVHGMVKVQAQAIKTTKNSNEPTPPSPLFL